LPTPSTAEEVKKPTEDDYELYQIFADTLDQVERNYVKDVSRRELMEAAIQGVLNKLDPYSNYISPEEIGRFKSSVENQFGGIGIQIGMENGLLKVISPLIGTPAYRAGLESGDIVMEIEGKPTDGIQIDEAVKRLKGEAGTKVTLTVRHLGSPTKETLTITRELVHVETVLSDRRKADDSWDFMLDHDKHIGYIRISAFSRDTAQDLKKALVELQKEGLKGLILDLRFNPGGLLTSAIEVSDLFVAKGRIVSTKGRNTAERVWEAEKDGTFEDFKMVVLVNHYSASASEIVSACLQDNDRAVVMGERTWGKGSVQNVIELEGGKSALKLTTASYHRPNGKNIHRFPDAKDEDEWGVLPNDGYELKLNGFQTGRLIEYRRQRDILVGKHAKAAASAIAKNDPKADPKDETPAAAEPAKTDEKPKAPDEPKPGDGPKPEETPKADPPKADESKPAEPAAAEPKVEPAKPDDAKPADPETAKPGGDSAPKRPTDDVHSDDVAAKEAAGPFVDLQLQKAIDFLTQELARAQ
jgi:carboxyl-terminal processing protease